LNHPVYHDKQTKRNQYNRLENNLIQMKYLKDIGKSEKELELFSRQRNIRYIERCSKQYKELVEKYKDELKDIQNQLGVLVDI
jgi:DNA-directed RNA polymerase subunit F